MSAPFERWNTHFSTVVEQQIFGLDFQLAQDPSSHNLGTTVWDASIVQAKFLEKNARKGEFSRLKVRGKRAVELGAGTGLGGMAFALLGADVVLTDIGEEVLSLLRKNVDFNVSPSALKLSGNDWAVDGAGTVTVAHLDWEDPTQYAAVGPPFDYILAADCVYNEKLVPPFLRTVLAMCGPKTQVIVTNEFRSSSVHDEFTAAFSEYFTMKKVTPNKMDPEFQHPLIQIYLMKRKKDSKQGAAAATGGVSTSIEPEAHDSDNGAGQQAEQDAVAAQISSQLGNQCSIDDKDTSSQQQGTTRGTESLGTRLATTSSSPSAAVQFATRRQGADLAKMLKDVQVPQAPGPESIIYLVTGD